MRVCGAKPTGCDKDGSLQRSRSSPAGPNGWARASPRSYCAASWCGQSGSHSHTAAASCARHYIGVVVDSANPLKGQADGEGSQDGTAAIVAGRCSLCSMAHGFIVALCPERRLEGLGHHRTSLPGPCRTDVLAVCHWWCARSDWTVTGLTANRRRLDPFLWDARARRGASESSPSRTRPGYLAHPLALSRG